MVSITKSKQNRYMDLTNQLAVARNSYNQLKESIHAMERELLGMMENDEIKSHNVGNHRITYVQATKVIVDEEGLRKAIGAKAFKKVAVLKLDRKLLERALDEDKIKPETVSPYIREEHGTPYIRMTERKTSD